MRRLIWTPGIVAALALQACKPFGDLNVDEGFTVPDGQGPTATLLTEDRRLPKSATNISGHIRQFQDSLLWVRFDAPLADARAFQADMLKTRSDPCGSWARAGLNWWPTEMPAGAECAEDSTIDGPEDPAILVAVVPDGATATVFVHASGD